MKRGGGNKLWGKYCRGEILSHHIRISYYINIRIYYYYINQWGFPNGSAGKESTCNAGEAGGLGSDPWVRKIHWRRKWILAKTNLMDKGAWQESRGLQRVRQN